MFLSEYCCWELLSYANEIDELMVHNIEKMSHSIIS